MTELLLMELKHFGACCEMTSASRTANTVGGNDYLQKIKTNLDLSDLSFNKVFEIPTVVRKHGEMVK